MKTAVLTITYRNGGVSVTALPIGRAVAWSDALRDDERVANVSVTALPARHDSEVQ